MLHNCRCVSIPITPKTEETMIECTLQEAIDLYRKTNGGKFFKKGSLFNWCVVLPNGYIVEEKTGKRIELNCSHLDSVWIYEPPKQSYFQDLDKAIVFKMIDISETIINILSTTLDDELRTRIKKYAVEIKRSAEES